MIMERVDEHTRTVTTPHMKYTIKRLEGIDLWTIKTEKGPVPRFLEGSYTTPQFAHTKIIDYVNSKEK